MKIRKEQAETRYILELSQEEVNEIKYEWIRNGPYGTCLNQLVMLIWE